jgi:hypothetical protein
MQVIQEVKTGRGGIRAGAGRKPTGNAATVPVRVDSRLIPFLNVVKVRGVDNELLAKIDALIAPVDLREELTRLYEIPAKNRSRDVQKYIKQALGFSVPLDDLNDEQKAKVIKYHKELRE